jgi:hypothetical protein
VRSSLLIPLAALVLLTAGCEESGTEGDNSYVTSDATKLLGLHDDFVCRYVQYDSVITYPPFEISVDTVSFSFKGIAKDSLQTEFDLWFDSARTAVVKITSDVVVNLGYYQAVGDLDSLVCFSEPAELFPIVVESEQSWESYAPPVFGTTTRLFLSWGFVASRRFERREPVLLPLGTFNCYVFLCEYRLPGDAEPFQTAREYYAEGHGLVKLHTAGAFGSSQVFMIDRDSVAP